MTTNQPPIYNGRYELRSQIARGGTAQVYLARDLVLDRPVALKVLFPEFATDHLFVERFRREGQAAANLSHPNIVPVFDWGESDSSYFIVMEYIDGEPLSAIIKAEAPLIPAQAASIGIGIAKALSYAHRHGVVHRDVKPSNVLITTDGQVKVTDFGIARAIGSDEQVTQTGLVMGTATYFSPEQAQGLPVDGRSDIYSLGVVLYEMVTGQPPFSGDNPVSIAYQHVREQPPSVRSLVPEVPVDLEAIIMQAMAKMPGERYGTAQELQADLERFVQGIRVAATVSAPVNNAALEQTQMVDQQTQLLSAPVVATMGAIDATTISPAVSQGNIPKAKAKTNTPKWAALSLILLIAIGVVVYFGGRDLGYFGATKFIKVPSLEGKKESTASSVLRNDGLTPIIVYGAPSKTDAGRVSTQHPKAGSELRQGDQVTIVIASQVKEIKVPRVTGMNELQASNKLIGDGFRVKVNLLPATSSSESQGTVISQHPGAGSMREPKSEVTIGVIEGAKEIQVPNLVNTAYTQVSSTLTKDKLVEGSTTYEFSSTVPKGYVISTSPAGGTNVFPSSSVSIVVSKGSGVTIPLLTGYSFAQASQSLQSLGITRIVERYKPTAIAGAIGNVLYTSPAAGKVVPPGSQIIVVMGIPENNTTTTTATNSGLTTTTATNSGLTTTTATNSGNSGNSGIATTTTPGLPPAPGPGNGNGNGNGNG